MDFFVNGWLTELEEALHVQAAIHFAPLPSPAIYPRACADRAALVFACFGPGSQLLRVNRNEVFGSNSSETQIVKAIVTRNVKD